MNDYAVQLNTQGCKYLQAQDYASAYKYFLEASQLGDSNAIYNVGYCLFHGYGVQKNYDKSVKILSRFANSQSGNAINAAYICGLMFDDGGYGLKPDRNQAIAFYNIAGGKGHAWAMYRLGRLSILSQSFSDAIGYLQDAINHAPNDYELQKHAKVLLRTAKIGRICK